MEVYSIKNNSNQKNIISIYECFEYNQKSELLNGDNKNYCNICKKFSDSIYTSNIFISPNILIIILSWENVDVNNIKLKFSEKIDITKYVLKKDESKIYSLYGVITNINKDFLKANSISFCKSPIDNKWYKYQDRTVNPTKNTQKEVIEFGTPYILFYQKNN